MIARSFLLLVLLVLTLSAWAQRKQELRWNLSENGEEYIKFTLQNQVWVRWNENNDGSLLYGEPYANNFDIGLRRTRFQLYGQLLPKVFFYAQFGQNNFNFLSQRKTGAFFHDVVCEYEVASRSVWLGGGLTAWTGLSRFSAPSVGTFLGVDAPLFAQSNNDIDDQFLRNLSVYAKGKLGKADYRLVLSKPMVIQNASSPVAAISQYSTFNTLPPQILLHGYLSYQFLDEESNTTAYTTGTYLGTKKVFNVGAGFKYRPGAMWYTEGSDTLKTDMLQFAVDVFYDAPLDRERNDAVSFYAGYFNFNFGPGYLRTLAPMNVATSLAPGSDNLNGPGVGYLAVGTGQVYYAQAGYLLPKAENKGTRWMPYASYTLQNFDRIGKNTSLIEAGINMFLNGHNSKLTLGWQNREQVTPQAGQEMSSVRKHAVILQYIIGF